MATPEPMSLEQPRRNATARFASGLSTLYFIRTVVSVGWVVALTTLAGASEATGGPSTRITVLLVVYPLADAAATLIDIRATPPDARIIAQPINLTTSLGAAALLLAVARRDWNDVIAVVGVWGIVSGAIQLLVAWSRRHRLAGQWLMLVSGAGSVFAGASFISWAGTQQAGVATLVQYSIGGAVWYLLTAVWLYVSAVRLAD
jgi:uncharacterized membrane protein